MEKKRTKLKLMILTILLLVIFAGTAAFSGIRAYRDRYANEKFDEIDIFSMHEFSRVNSEKALQALKDGNRESLEGIMVSSAGLEGVMNFAEWGELDIENAVSMGSGSLSAKANDKGMIDVSERFIAEAGVTQSAPWFKASMVFPRVFPTRRSHEAFPQGCPTCTRGGSRSSA